MIIINNLVANIYVYSLSMYIFLSALFGAYNLIYMKQLSIFMMMLFLVLYLIINLNAQKTFLEWVLLLIFPFLVGVYLTVWDNYQELTLIMSIMLGYVASKKYALFKKIIFLVIIVQFFAIIFEFLSNEYIFTEVIQGLDGAKEATIRIESYGDVGFRPKGIFFGTLEATSFIIISALIFFNQRLILFLLMIMGIMTNGRWALIVLVIILFFSFYEFIKKIKISYQIKTILYITPFLMVILFFFVFIKFQSSESVDNFLNVLDFQSNSNYARIEYTILGFFEFSNYEFKNILFGNSDYFNQKYGHSAESGWINQLLNIGLIGFSIYLFFIFYLSFLAFKNRQYSILISFIIIFLSVTIYRFETGYLRGVLLWFYIFHSYFELMKSKFKQSVNIERK